MDLKIMADGGLGDGRRSRESSRSQSSRVECRVVSRRGVSRVESVDRRVSRVRSRVSRVESSRQSSSRLRYVGVE